MTDAPERIWAVPERNCTVYMSGNSPITAQDGPFTHRLHGTASEYIRADLVQAMEAENDRLREALAPFGGAAESAIGVVGKTTTLGVLGAIAVYFVTWRDFARARAALNPEGEA